MGELRDRCPEMVALLRYTTDSIFFKRYVNGGFIFELVSESKARRCGKMLEEVIGRTDFDLLFSKEEAQKCHEDEMHILLTGEVLVDKEEELTKDDGTTKWVSVSKFPWYDDETGEIVGIIGISRDITEKKKMEKHILNMLSIATHDMRSPVVAIIMTVKLLIKGRFGSMDKSVKKTLSEVFDRMTKLEKIIGTYLVKSSIMSSDSVGGKEIIDVRTDVIDPLLGEFLNEIEKKNIRIDNNLGGIPSETILVEAKNFVEANKNHLEIVYRNLLDNAIKYTPSGGEIAFGFEDKGDVYRLNVFNTGEPVPLEKREVIFEMFESKDSSGIGLAICRELIRRHGGDLFYEEAPDGHPNFIIILPKRDDIV